MTTNQLKQKILYVITQGEWGGAQRYVYDLATNLTNEFPAKGGPASGWEIIIAIGEPKRRKELQDKIERLKDYKITIVQLEHLVRNISPIHDILAIFELAKLYKTLKPDLIHLNSSKASIIGSLAKLVTFTTFTTLQLTTIIYTVHGWVFNEPLGRIKKALYRWLEKLTARWKNKIIVLSDFDYQTGQKAGIPTDKLVKIPLGIETPSFLNKENARQELSKLSPISYLPSHTIIGTIANLYKTKGLDILIEATKIIRDTRYKIQDIKFIIVGEGPERKKLEKLIKKYHLESTVHLVGAIENAAQYLRAFDLFVLPSRKEGLPYTILEAMTANTPIIATNVGGIPSLITSIASEKTCLLVEPDNAKKLAEAIQRVMNNLEEVKKRAERASEKTQEFALKKMVSSTFSLYSSARHS